jgi:hypothetical protein
LPVFQPTTFELVVNMKAANALSFTIPSQSVPGTNAVIE